MEVQPARTRPVLSRSFDGSYGTNLSKSEDNSNSEG